MFNWAIDQSSEQYRDAGVREVISRLVNYIDEAPSEDGSQVHTRICCALADTKLSADWQRKLITWANAGVN